jgi:hypothetical protein
MFALAGSVNQDFSSWDVTGDNVSSTGRSFGFLLGMHYSCDLIASSNEYLLDSMFVSSLVSLVVSDQYVHSVGDALWY